MKVNNPFLFWFGAVIALSGSGTFVGEVVVSIHTYNEIGIGVLFSIVAALAGSLMLGFATDSPKKKQAKEHG